MLRRLTRAFSTPARTNPASSAARLASLDGHPRFGRVLLFDGVCNFCNARVNFVMKHNNDQSVHFAAHQSEFGKELFALCGLGNLKWEDSVVFVENGRAFAHSDAALRVCQYLSFPFSLLYWLVLVPRPLRDAVYSLIGTNRYRWFGKAQTCRLPTRAERARFLNDDADLAQLRELTSSARTRN